jgi:hypothetical protein
LFLENLFRIVLSALLWDRGVEEYAHTAHVQADSTGRALILPGNRQRQCRQ